MRYSRVEDRIRMDAEVTNGGVVGFWLTQRLCREIVKTLLGHIGREGLKASRSDRGAQSAVQGHLHQAARQARMSSKAVKRAEESSAELLSKIRMRTGRKSVQLLLPRSDGSTASLSLTLVETRQWLDVLYKQ